MNKTLEQFVRENFKEPIPAGNNFYVICPAHEMFFPFGPPASGKSTFLNLLAAALGEYSAPMETVKDKKSNRNVYIFNRSANLEGAVNKYRALKERRK